MVGSLGEFGLGGAPGLRDRRESVVEPLAEELWVQIHDWKGEKRVLRVSGCCFRVCTRKKSDTGIFLNQRVERQ